MKGATRLYSAFTCTVTKLFCVSEARSEALSNCVSLIAATLSYVAIYHFFKLVKKLPDPNGELSATVSPEAIREANKEVSAAMEAMEQGSRKPYKHISDMLRVSKGRYALENGNATAVRKYSDQFDTPVNESTV